jgi:hypothetical protein
MERGRLRFEMLGQGDDLVDVAVVGDQETARRQYLGDERAERCDIVDRDEVPAETPTARIRRDQVRLQVGDEVEQAPIIAGFS